jgi:hypothetical protein
LKASVVKQQVSKAAVPERVATEEEEKEEVERL